MLILMSNERTLSSQQEYYRQKVLSEINNHQIMPLALANIISHFAVVTDEEFEKIKKLLLELEDAALKARARYPRKF